MRHVSTHAPARGATLALARVSGHVEGFNPRAREGRDHRAQRVRAVGRRVSTHAPARGATFAGIFRPAMTDVSTHAPARGATRNSYPPYPSFWRFNPRAREGRDFFRDAHFSVQRIVSTHAPARGATSGNRPAGRRRTCFNPRAREGRDIARRGISVGKVAFQPTRPRGARPLGDGVAVLTSLFQPTRPRGARRRRCRRRSRPSSFNPRAREGRDHSDGAASPGQRRFQPTRPRGARRQTSSFSVICGTFQPTRPRGARLVIDAPPVQ